MHVLLRVGDEFLAVPVDQVREVDRIGEVAPVPGAPAGILGVRTLRGRVLPVVDLALVLGIAGSGRPRHIVLAHDGDRRAGLAVDAILDVTAITGALAADAAPLLTGSVLDEGRLIGVVDVPRVFDELEGQ
jgi:purine-binding chemotaxis protein CheW